MSTQEHLERLAAAYQAYHTLCARRPAPTVFEKLDARAPILRALTHDCESEVQSWLPTIARAMGISSADFATYKSMKNGHL